MILLIEGKVDGCVWVVDLHVLRLAFVFFKNCFLLTFPRITKRNNLTPLHQLVVQSDIQVHLLEILFPRNSSHHSLIVVVRQGGAGAESMRLSIICMPGSLLPEREPLLKIVASWRRLLFFGPAWLTKKWYVVTLNVSKFLSHLPPLCRWWLNSRKSLPLLLGQAGLPRQLHILLPEATTLIHKWVVHRQIIWPLRLGIFGVSVIVDLAAIGVVSCYSHLLAKSDVFELPRIIRALFGEPWATLRGSNRLSGQGLLGRETAVLVIPIGVCVQLIFV